MGMPKKKEPVRAVNFTLPLGLYERLTKLAEEKYPDWFGARTGLLREMIREGVEAREEMARRDRGEK
jgi:hypothetical protein